MQRMPGHWVLSRLGKRVLRPGGRGLTDQLVAAVGVGPRDRVVELAPGLGVTADRLLAEHPESYVGVERDGDAATVAQRAVGDRGRIAHAPAQHIPLPDGAATVVIGEAMLTMQNPENKARIVAEAVRVLAPGGRYGIHELCIVPSDVSAEVEQAIDDDLSRSIHVGARPLTIPGWRALLGDAGLVVEAELAAPMRLLSPRRVLDDEGLVRTLGIAGRLVRDGAARARVREMRACFERWRHHIAAVALVARKR